MPHPRARHRQAQLLLLERNFAKSAVKRRLVQNFAAAVATRCKQRSSTSNSYNNSLIVHDGHAVPSKHSCDTKTYGLYVLKGHHAAASAASAVDEAVMLSKVMLAVLGRAQQASPAAAVSSNSHTISSRFGPPCHWVESPYTHSMKTKIGGIESPMLGASYASKISHGNHPCGTHQEV